MMVDLLPQTSAQLDRCREEGLIVHGVQLSVSFRGERITELGWGEARPGVDMTPDTITRLHCAGIPLTSVALAQLISQGLVGLDQPVQHFLPALTSGGKDRVTLRHLLTHTAGLHASDERASVFFSEPEILQVICDQPLPEGWVVGAQATFSSFSSWQVLGQVIETVTGLPLREHLRHALFIPLGMTDTWVGMSPEDHDGMRERLGVLYIQEEYSRFDQGLPLGPMWHELSQQTCTLAAPTGGYAPARDLRRFYEALLDPDELADLTSIDPAVLEQFVTPQRTGMYDRGLQRVCDYGFGFMVNLRGHQFGDACSTRSYGHSGLHGSSLAFADEDHRIVVALVSNDVLFWRRCFERRTALLDAVYEDLGLRPSGGSTGPR